MAIATRAEAQRAVRLASTHGCSFDQALAHLQGQQSRRRFAKEEGDYRPTLLEADVPTQTPRTTQSRRGEAPQPASRDCVALAVRLSGQYGVPFEDVIEAIRRLGEESIMRGVEMARRSGAATFDEALRQVKARVAQSWLEPQHFDVA
jgi:hypothetical protein